MTRPLWECRLGAFAEGSLGQKCLWTAGLTAYACHCWVSPTFLFVPFNTDHHATHSHVNHKKWLAVRLMYQAFPNLWAFSSADASTWNEAPWLSLIFLIYQNLTRAPAFPDLPSFYVTTLLHSLVSWFFSIDIANSQE